MKTTVGRRARDVKGVSLMEEAGQIETQTVLQLTDEPPESDAIINIFEEPCVINEKEEFILTVVVS